MKQWSVRFPLLALVVCLVASLLATGCVTPETAQEAESRDDPGQSPPAESEEPEKYPALAAEGNRPAFKAVDLTYMGAVDPAGECKQVYPGDECVMARPVNASIWKGKDKYKGKPNKVKWWVDEAQKKEYSWDIVYKGPDSKNWIGPVTAIDCNKKSTKSKAVLGDLHDGINLEWSYQITVWKCEKNQRVRCLCMTDPRIEIHD